MGFTFAMPFLMMVFAIIAGLILMILIGVGIVALGVGGGVIASATVTDKAVKKTLIYVFAAVILSGITCISPLVLMADIQSTAITFFISAANIITIFLSIKGIRSAAKLEKKGIKFTTIIFSSIILIFSLILFMISTLLLITIFLQLPK